MHNYSNNAKNKYMLRYVLPVFVLICIIFPIFSKVLLFWNNEHQKMYFLLHIFGFIKIYGGYLQLTKDALAIHISRTKAYLMPYKEVLSTTGQKLKITRGFHLSSVTVWSEIGYDQNKCNIFLFALLQIVFLYAYLIGQQKVFNFHSNTELSQGNRICLFIKTKFVFNILILLIAAMKILINKGIEYAKRNKN